MQEVDFSQTSGRCHLPKFCIPLLVNRMSEAQPGSQRAPNSAQFSVGYGLDFVPETQIENQLSELVQKCLHADTHPDLMELEDQELSNLLSAITACSIRNDATVDDLQQFQTLLLGCAQSLAQRLKIHSSLCQLALTDDLTGLYNHRGFLVLGMQLLKLAVRDRQDVLLFFFDVNHLKKINDQHGHSAGDVCLIRCANVLNRTFRRSDIIARYGGDEFVVLALETHDNGREAILRRLEANVKEANATSVLFELSVSVGIARFDHLNPISLAEMLMEGDSLMYARKHSEF